LPEVTLLICVAFLGAELKSGLGCLRRDGRLAAERQTLLARPMMFAFLFSWALPLSFLPLYAATLAEPRLVALPPNWIMALPISAEMLFAFLAAVLAGSLADRRGWRVPVRIGLGVSLTGALLSAVAQSFELFMLARAATGFGYGLAWVGIQSLVVRQSRPETLTFGVANLTAGIFTGHLLGAVVGGWIADMSGYRIVFLVSALATCLPALYLATVMRGSDAAPGRPQVELRPDRVLALLGNRNFVVLLLGSVIPFSIAQVGLLYYAAPVLLRAEGFSGAEIGQVIALYSGTLVFVAPFAAKLIDRRPSKKIFIVAGGLLGSVALLGLFVSADANAVIAATLALGLASCVGGAANSSYALQFEEVRRLGVASATGVQRAADKLGQMLGPLTVSALFGVAGLAEAVAITGGIYLVATLVFLALAARPGRTGEERHMPGGDAVQI
jgi:predicted MFS family arabinose efflux permease